MLKTSFHSAVQQINFAQSEKAAKVGCLTSSLFFTFLKEINGWVEKKTKDKIKDLVDPNVLNAQTVFVLINAIYFKAKWKHQFEKSKARSKLFYTESKSEEMQSKEVQMMDLTETLELFDLDLGGRMLRLPYEGDMIVLDILLPNPSMFGRAWPPKHAERKRSVYKWHHLWVVCKKKISFSSSSLDF